MIKTLSQNKRLSFILTSLVVAGSLIFLNLSPYSRSLPWTALTPTLAFILSYFALRRPGGIEVVTLPTLPTFLSWGASLNQVFYPNFSLPVKIVSWVGFFLLFYILLLALNVFRVERMKKEEIPLEKAAKPAILLTSFLVAFLLTTAVYKLSLGIILTSLSIFVIGSLIALNFLWFFFLSDLFDRRQLLGAIAAGAGLLQISVALAFFPLDAHLLGLSEAVFFYSIVGVVRAYFKRHLKYSVVLEYILISLGVFLLVQFI